MIIQSMTGSISIHALCHISVIPDNDIHQPLYIGFLTHAYMPFVCNLFSVMDSSIKSTSVKHGAAFPVFIYLASDSDLIGQIHIKPCDLSVIDLRELIIKTAAQINTQCFRILTDKPFQFFSIHDGSCNNPLMR